LSGIVNTFRPSQGSDEMVMIGDGGAFGTGNQYEYQKSLESFFDPRDMLERKYPGSIVHLEEYSDFNPYKD
jgi:hypothetical protein